MTDAEKFPGRFYGGEPIVFSLRDQYKNLGLEAIMAVNESFDGMWSYVLDDTNLGKMTFQKPGRVLAYELQAPNWNGQGNQPAVASNGKLESKVGWKLKDFAKSRNDTKTADWVLTNLWIVLRHSNRMQFLPEPSQPCYCSYRHRIESQLLRRSGSICSKLFKFPFFNSKVFVALRQIIHWHAPILLEILDQ